MLTFFLTLPVGTFSGGLAAVTSRPTSGCLQQPPEGSAGGYRLAAFSIPSPAGAIASSIKFIRRQSHALAPAFTT